MIVVESKGGDDTIHFNMWSRIKKIPKNAFKTFGLNIRQTGIPLTSTIAGADYSNI